MESITIEEIKPKVKPIDQQAIICRNIEHLQQGLKEAERIYLECERQELQFPPFRIGSEVDLVQHRAEAKRLRLATEDARANMRHLQWSLEDQHKQLKNLKEDRQLTIF